MAEAVASRRGPPGRGPVRKLEYLSSARPLGTDRKASTSSEWAGTTKERSASLCRSMSAIFLTPLTANFAKKYEVYAYHGLQGTDDELARKVTGDLETLMDDTFLVGSPEECVGQIATYHEMGFTDVALRLFYPEMSQVEVLEHIDLVGREVIPALHAL